MSALSRSLKGTTYLIALQAGSRLLTFTLNQLILRYTSPAVFGFATIQLELLLSTILFLCREGFRLATQRQPRSATAAQVITNLSYIPIVFGLALSTLASFWFSQNAADESKIVPYFNLTVVLYGISAILELLSEPGYNSALHGLQFSIRAFCEGMAVLVRCFVAFTVAVYGQGNSGALSFAYGQLAYSVALLLCYRVMVPGVWVPRNIDGTWFPSTAITLALTNTSQGVLKHLLTEGDKVMISYFSSNDEQGKYGLASNYGGLIARMLFQPIEEAARSYFSNVKMEETADRAQASAVMSTVLHAYLLLSGIVVAVLPLLISTLLPAILTSRWQAITPILCQYIYYIPLLALNGILEAFVAATASPGAVKNQSILWTICSIVFAALGFAFRNHGALGLIYANCGNLLLRILWSASYTQQNLHLDTSLLPSLFTISSLIGVHSVLRYVQFTTVSHYLSRIGALGFLTLFSILYGERAWLRQLYSMVT